MLRSLIAASRCLTKDDCSVIQIGFEHLHGFLKTLPRHHALRAQLHFQVHVTVQFLILSLLLIQSRFNVVTYTPDARQRQ
jgi:hypothetical protein